MPCFEQRLAQAAKIDLFANHHRHDGRFAGQHGKAARHQFVAQQLRDAQQTQAALRLFAHDLERLRHRRNRGRRQTGREHKGPRGVLQVIDYGLFGRDKAAD